MTFLIFKHSLLILFTFLQSRSGDERMMTLIEEIRQNAVLRSFLDNIHSGQIKSPSPDCQLCSEAAKWSCERVWQALFTAEILMTQNQLKLSWSIASRYHSASFKTVPFQPDHPTSCLRQCLAEGTCIAHKTHLMKFQGHFELSHRGGCPYS